MKKIEIKCPCCCAKLNLLINETGEIALQSFDLYGAETLQKITCEEFGLEFGEKGGKIIGKRKDLYSK